MIDWTPPVWLLLEPWDGVLLALYYGALGLLGVLGVHRLLLVRRTLAGAAIQPLSTEGGRSAGAELPSVTVQLPLYNEPRVAARLVESVVALDYPSQLLQIQVLDDSDDATSREVEAVVRAAAARGVDIEHLRRGSRHGYKAGALAWGLRRARGEMLAVFDADFLPLPDFLLRAVQPFSDPRVGMVQARWTHLNREQSLLTRLQAVLLDAPFLVEHRGRFRSGCFFNFNGTAGVWRRQAIEQAGGWQHDTLTEDLDLSYRSQLAGWRFVFCEQIEAPAELPADLRSFRTQQRRWTQGSTQTLRKLLPALLRQGSLSLRARLEALLHLGSNLGYVPLVLVAGLMPWAAFARVRVGLESLVVLDLALLLLATGALAVFYAVGQRLAGRSVLSALALHPALVALGVGMSVHNAAAALRGLISPGGEFVRTPKSGRRDREPVADEPSRPEAAQRAGRRSTPVGSSGAQVVRPEGATWVGSEARARRVGLLRLDAGRCLSLALGLQLVWGCVQAARLGLLWALPFQALFALGLIAVCVSEGSGRGMRRRCQDES